MNDLIFVVKLDGSYELTPTKNLRAQENYANSFVVITNKTGIVKLNIKLLSRTDRVLSQFMIPTLESPADFISDRAFFQDYANAKVYRIALDQSFLEEISMSFKGEVEVSFDFLRLVSDPRAITFKGDLLEGEELPETATEGDYFVIKTSSYTLGTITFSYGQTAIWTTEWVKGGAYKVIGTTLTHKMNVEQTLIGQQPEFDIAEESELLEQLVILSTELADTYRKDEVYTKVEVDLLNDEQDLAIGENASDITALEGEIADIKDGTTVVDKALKDDLGNTIKSTYANKLDLAYSSSNNRIAITLKGYDGTSLDADLIELPKATTVIDGLMAKEDKAYVDGLPSALLLKENKSEKGVANGYASLDGGAKIPTSQLPDSILGQLEYKGTFSPSSGYPVSPEKGWFYISIANALISGVDYKVGDWAVYNGVSWDKVDNTDAVASVNGKLGVVILYGNEIQVGNGDTWTVEQRIVNIYAELNNRYTKAQTYSNVEIEQRITDLLGLANLQDTAVEFSAGVYDLSYNGLVVSPFAYSLVSPYNWVILQVLVGTQAEYTIFKPSVSTNGVGINLALTQKDVYAEIMRNGSNFEFSLKKKNDNTLDTTTATMKAWGIKLDGIDASDISYNNETVESALEKKATDLLNQSISVLNGYTLKELFENGLGTNYNKTNTTYMGVTAVRSTAPNISFDGTVSGGKAVFSLIPISTKFLVIVSETTAIKNPAYLSLYTGEDAFVNLLEDGVFIADARLQSQTGLGVSIFDNLEVEELTTKIEYIDLVEKGLENVEEKVLKYYYSLYKQLKTKQSFDVLSQQLVLANTQQTYGNIYEESLYKKGLYLDFSGGGDITLRSRNDFSFLPYSSIIISLTKGKFYKIKRINSPRFRVAVFDKDVRSYRKSDVISSYTLTDHQDNYSETEFVAEQDGLFMVIYLSNDGIKYPVEIWTDDILVLNDKIKINMTNTTFIKEENGKICVADKELQFEKMNVVFNFDLEEQPDALGGEDSFADASWGSVDVYDELYEPLRTKYPNYISRTNIGKDESGTYDMFAYILEPRTYDQTIFLQSGVHAYEEDAYLALARFIQLLCEEHDKSELFSYLRWNVRFVIVPIVNVWGTNQTPKTRDNSSSINLNRDAENRTQQETKNVMALIENYKNDISFFFDLHTTVNNSYGDYMFLYNSNAPNIEISLKTIDFLVDKNIKGRTANLQNVGIWEQIGMFHQEVWNYYGITSATVEHSDYVWDVAVHTSKAITMAVETFANHIYQHAKQYFKIVKGKKI